MVTSVGGTSCWVGTERALTTVTSLGGGPTGGRPACTLVGYSDGDSGRRTGGADRRCGTDGGTGWAPLRRGPAGGATGADGVDHDMVDCAAGGEALPGGRPPFARRGPTSNVSRGPPALPMLMLCPSWISITGLR